MALKLDTLLNNRYRIISILGQGGMGAVYCARDEHLDILVAVKENLFLSDEYARQFQHEANILASLRHPCLPRVGDYFSTDGEGQYLIMDYVEGEDLRERIERVGTLSERETLVIGVSVCEALAYMHKRVPPVIHRDIKPGNIKITPSGEAVLVDFGLAKVMRGSQHTTTGARAMTPGYSPPEQYGTARTDARSDIYSLGATLYAALTGVIPEDSLSRATGKAVLTTPRKLKETVSRATETVLSKALEIEPDDRYQTAEEFAADLLTAGNLREFSRPRLTVSPPPGAADRPTNNIDEDQAAVEIVRKAKPHSGKISGKKSGSKKQGGNWKIRPITILPMLLIALFTITAFFTPAMTDWASNLIYPPPPATVIKTATQALVAAVETETPVTGITEDTGTPTEIPTDEPTQTPTETLMPRPTSTPNIFADTATPIPSPIPSSFVGGGYGQIAFVSDRTGIMQIWMMNSDGSQQHQLTNFAEGACQPAWSPNGQQLAVISPCTAKSSKYYEKAQIYIIDADGTNPRLLPSSTPGDFDPAWSPDGDKIAFASLRNNNRIAHIYVYHFKDQLIEELSDTRYADIQPAWRPNSKQIAFVREKPYNHIWVMSDQGQTEFQFSTSGSVHDLWPAWTPDGDAMLYSRAQVETGIPWLLMLNYEDRGSAETRIPRIGEGDLGPVAMPDISSDGKWIAYESWPDGRNHDIWLTNFDGSQKIRLTTDPGFDFDPAWRPYAP